MVFAARVLREITLEEPIRYGKDDLVEKWLNDLLCLDCASPAHMPRIITGVPHPSLCDLYYVNRDTLFSFHSVSEHCGQRGLSSAVRSSAPSSTLTVPLPLCAGVRRPRRSCSG